MATDEPFGTGRVLIVAAHSDDETIGAGGQLARLRDRVDIVHVTNGSPGSDSHYAAVRRKEVLNALALAGIAPKQCHELGIVDQQTSFHLAELARWLFDLIEHIQPATVLTHPYEGGHPDHDSTAFACHMAVELLRRERASCATNIWEFTSYHMDPQRNIETGVFLGALEGVEAIEVSPAGQTLKRGMFDCFASQQKMLAWFGVERESFRPAPRYDFTQPPHPGQLFYEQFDWGVTGPRWRELAAETLSKLGLNLHATHSS